MKLKLEITRMGGGDDRDCIFQVVNDSTTVTEIVSVKALQGMLINELARLGREYPSCRAEDVDLLDELRYAAEKTFPDEHDDLDALIDKLEKMLGGGR